MIRITPPLGKDFLNACRKGIWKVKVGEYDASLGYEFTHEELTTFYRDYEIFIKAYLKGIENIVNMPQYSFNKAVKTILDLQKYKDRIRLDFQHTGNTIIDMQNFAFRFVDLQFDPGEFLEHDEPNLTEFAKVLLGKSSNLFLDRRSPFDLIIRDNDRAKFLDIVNRLSHKIEIAAKENGNSWNNTELIKSVSS